MKEKDLDRLYDAIVQPNRDERSMELFNKKENELDRREQLMLEKYINDYNKPPIWKQVIWDNCFTNYEVSNMGQVRSTKNGNILNPSANEFGYLRVRISTRPCEWHTVKVHRLVATAFITNPKKKREVNHISCVKTCNWVGNLEWATSEENKKHAREHGLYHDVYGQDKYNVKYTDEQIREVCKLLEEGYGPRYVANKLNIPVACPMSIKYNGRWKHIAKDYNIPKVGVNKPMRNVGSSKCTEEQIRNVCDLLSQGKGPREVSKLTGIGEAAIAYIYRRETWTDISKDYIFPDIRDKISSVTKQKDLVISFLNNGETDYGVILSKIGEPDTRQNRKLIASIKAHMKK